MQNEEVLYQDVIIVCIKKIKKASFFFFFFKAHKIFWVAHKLTGSVGNRNQTKKMFRPNQRRLVRSWSVVSQKAPTLRQILPEPLTELLNFF